GDPARGRAGGCPGGVKRRKGVSLTPLRPCGRRGPSCTSKHFKEIEMMDDKTQAFLSKVAGSADMGVRSEGLFQAQLHAVINTVADPQATWPARLRIRFDGPDLVQW